MKREILATWDDEVTRTRQRGKTAGKHAKIDSAPSAVSLHKHCAGRSLTLFFGDKAQKQSPIFSILYMETESLASSDQAVRSHGLLPFSARCPSALLPASPAWSSAPAGAWRAGRFAGPHVISDIVSFFILFLYLCWRCIENCC